MPGPTSHNRLAALGSRCRRSAPSGTPPQSAAVRSFGSRRLSTPRAGCWPWSPCLAIGTASPNYRSIRTLSPQLIPANHAPPRLVLLLGSASACGSFSSLGRRKMAAARGSPDASAWLTSSAALADVLSSSAAGCACRGSRSCVASRMSCSAGLVDGGCAQQHGGAGDAEVVQDAFDGAGRRRGRRPGGCWVRLYVAGRSAATVAAGFRCGARVREDLARRTDGCGGCRDVRRWPGRWRRLPHGRRPAASPRGSGVPGEPVRDVEVVEQAAGGHEQPPGPCGRVDLSLAGVGESRQGVAGVMHRGHDGREVTRFGGEALRGAGCLGGSEGEGPFGVGVGEPPGPESQVCCLGGGR